VLLRQKAVYPVRLFTCRDLAGAERFMARLRALLVETQQPCGFEHDRWLIDGKICGQHTWPTSHLSVATLGQGWAIGGDRVQVELRAGDGVYWEANEWFALGGSKGFEALSADSQILYFESLNTS